MGSVENCDQLYMDNTIQNDNQQYLNDVDIDYLDIWNDLNFDEPNLPSNEFNIPPSDTAPETDSGSVIDPALAQSHGSGTQSNQNSPSNSMPNSWDNPTARSSLKQQEAIQMPMTSLEQKLQSAYQANHDEGSKAQPNMSLACNVASNSNTPYVDTAANGSLALFSPHGQTDPFVPSATGQPHLNQNNFIQHRSEYNPHLPFYNYPELGIEGNQIAHGIAQYPTRVQTSVPLQPMHNTIHTIQVCRGCWREPHSCECFPVAIPQQALAPYRQTPPYQAPYRQPIGLRAAPKRPAMFDEDSDEEKPLKKPRKIARSSRAKGGKKSRMTASEAYHFPRYPLNWASATGFEYEYIENGDGQWTPKFKLSAECLKDYIQNCPRDLTIWLQHNPAQAKHRTIDADMKCRYEGCPIKSQTIRHGWFRVAFDEFPDATSRGKKDPFKMAGAMHLWCLEQCIDPAALLKTGMMQPDTRELDWEEANPMAITRDTDTFIVDKTITPWLVQRQGRLIQVPFARHEDSLSYALCVHHRDNETCARQRTRDTRNENKPEEFKKTLEYHLGRLDWWAERENAFRRWKQAQKKEEDAAQEVHGLPAPSTPNGLFPTQKSAELTPNGSTKNFDHVLSTVSVQNDWAFGYETLGTPTKRESASLSGIPPPSQFFMEPRNDVYSTPKGEAHPQAQVVITPRRSARLSSGSLTQSVQTEINVATSPVKVQSSGLALPTGITKVAEEQRPTVVTPSQKEETPSLTGSEANDLWGESPQSRTSSRAGDGAQGSPLRRRSRRVSAKKSP
ncbi:hypothetical protein FBEOM_3811 [Fusarium beomiforme]|uniref:Uncharacterized protein n=1 Tax=Fusarium beomiforme TaxID=44412 RepID=A0A9P5APD0_9HYPO|nr:hypothetical protein FBEOM_3811 [Fusarium beomiforme]